MSQVRDLVSGQRLTDEMGLYFSVLLLFGHREGIDWHEKLKLMDSDRSRLREGGSD